MMRTRTSPTRDPFFVDRELADRAGLRVFEDLPGIGWCHVVQERRFGERISNLLCCWLKDDRAGSRHDGAPHAKPGHASGHERAAVQIGGWYAAV
ncbi:MAG TPA: hypothetical protein VI094_13485 [Propionibacteriaceae bacterium]